MSTETSEFSRQQLHQSLLDELESGKLRLPLLPNAVTELINITMREDADATLVSRLLHRDPALASHVLRVSNSAAYGGSSRIVSLQQAIARLGMRNVKDIVVSISLRVGVFNVPGCRNLVQRYWKQALITGVYAKHVARAKTQNTEIAFVCGLLYKIGKPIALQAIADGLQQESMNCSTEVKLEMVDELHQVYGEHAAKSWQLPTQVYESIKNSHNFAGATEHQDEVAAAFLADLLAQHALDPENVTAESVQDHEVRTALYLYPEDAEKLLALKDDVLKTVESMQS